MKRLYFISALLILSLSLFALCSCGHTHEFGEWKVTLEATCENEGARERICSCGEVESEAIAVEQHTASSWVTVTESTCTVDGERAQSCTKCGVVLERETIAAAHTPSEWDTVEEATCTADGERTRDCTECGIELEREVITALGHACESYVYNFDATATKDGTASGICTACDQPVTKTLEGSSALISSAFDGKTVSILGDSISTFLNVSNGDAADTTNSTIRDGVLYYDQQKIDDMGVSLADTWWQRTANELGASILVNNSWSGSLIKDASTNTRSTPGAYLGRAVNLHDNTGDNAGQKPDVIFVYMGTNDYYKYRGNVGTVNDALFDSLPDKLGDKYVAASVAEAYAIMLYKMSREYPDAEIYCLNVLESPSTNKTDLAKFNGMIKDICEHFGGVYVDICEGSGIKNDSTYESYVPLDDGDGTPNTLHPNSEGMALISDYLLDVIYKNSKFIPDMSTLVN